MIVGVIQMTSGRDVDQNFEVIESWSERLVSQGAKWILTPENAPYLGKDAEKLAVAESIGGAMMQRFADIAKRLSIWFTVGSFPERFTDTHTQNTSVTFDPNGNQIAVYRKMHLFDVDVSPDTSFRESDSIAPGNELVSFELGDFHVGKSVCYDLRFPELYRKLVDRGANVLLVPSAFTKETGRDHWHALLRARAIENQAYVIAPNQLGNHFGTRWSYGRSAVFDPWGNMIACAEDRTTGFVVELNVERIEEVRQKIPCLSHRRLDGAADV